MLLMEFHEVCRTLSSYRLGADTALRTNTLRWKGHVLPEHILWGGIRHVVNSTT
jgi:hypothetical protein